MIKEKKRNETKSIIELLSNVADFFDDIPLQVIRERINEENDKGRKKR
jgi:hypothetical protein